MNTHLSYAAEAEEPFILITRCEGELVEEEIQEPSYSPFFEEFQKIKESFKSISFKKSISFEKATLSYQVIPFGFTRIIAEENPRNVTEFTVPSLTDVNEPILQITKTGNLWINPTIQGLVLQNRSGKIKMSIPSSHELSEENMKEKMETLENGDKLIAWFSDHSKVSIDIECLVN